METQTSFINNESRVYSSKINQPNFINKIGSSYDSESARLIPISGNFKNELNNNKQKRKVIIARVFICLCLFICVGLASMGLFHYLITNDRRLDSISILFWSGSAFLIIVLIICLMAKNCGD
ncbi:hypothetical protein RB653_009071 [Dictyostelium firmibasis]|uniref:Transmembrane protein n=1 Tax=Dictyostelium firmibasis TaxID=79012 RepID=A0AAN7U1N1_9MYCE